MKVKLAELLLRRKELAEKVQQTKAVQSAQVYDTKLKRQQVTENIEDVIATVPKLTLSQVTAEHDHYSRALRMVDAAIQQANWTCEVEIDPPSMMSWQERADAIKNAQDAVRAATQL